MNPVKTYQNISFKELIACSEQNPHRSAVLKIEEVKQTDDRTLHKLDLPEYVSYVIQPASILSICNCISDPNYYYMAPPNARTQLLIDITTTLQQKTDELKTSAISRKRRKIYDLIGAAYDQSAMTDKDTLELIHGISVLCSLQFVIIKETVQDNIENGSMQDTALKGEILFGTNPIHWTKEYPIWIIDFKSRWIAIPHTVMPDHIYSILGNWLEGIQQKRWIVQWPEIDETKTELIHKLMQLPGWQETDRKLSKDQLSSRLGRLQTLQQLNSFV